MFNTGYASRVAEKQNKLNKLLTFLKERNCRLVFIKDEIWGRGLYQYNSEGELIDESKKKDLDNPEETDGILETLKNEHVSGICIATDEIINIIKIHSKLVSLNYCGFLTNIYDTEKIDNIIFCKYDTESG